MRSPGVRLVLFFNVVALAAVTVGFVLAVGLPLAAQNRLTPAVFTTLTLASAGVLVVAGGALLSRIVARPVNRLLEAAARLDPARQGAGLPILGEPGGLTLPRAAIAFERVASALEQEQRRLAAKVGELTVANAQLAAARESLVRTEKLATVGRLAAGLAHEVGNPLGAITGYADLARRRLPAEPHPELADAIDRIDAAAARIDRTVQELLDFARPTVAVLLPVDLGTVLDGALRLAGMQARFRDVVVETALDPDATRIVADEHHLLQVLLNLLLNAADATNGRGKVRVTSRRDGEWVVVGVADQGAGIPEEDLPRIFDPFFTTKEPGKGTGLGLAITHRLMESFGGGVVAIARGPLGGALFELTFRCA